jgi:hypothetical protein
VKIRLALRRARTVFKRHAVKGHERRLAWLIILTSVIASPAATAHLGQMAPAADTQPAPICTAVDTAVDNLPTDYVFRALRTCTLELEEGRQYRWSGRWEATATTGSLMGVRVEAYPLGATSASQRIRSTVATRNHRGDASKAPVGTEWLFSPPSSGTYVVELRAQAGRCDNQLVDGKLQCVTQPQHQVNVVDGANTFLRPAPNSYAGGVEWRQSVEMRIGLASDSRAAKVDALWQTHQLPPGTQLTHIWAGLGVSVESTGGSAALQLRYTLFVRQLTANGAYCNVASKVGYGTIDGTLHHYRFNPIMPGYQLDPACGTTKINVKVYVEYLPAPAGQPERHGGVVHAEPYSGAHIIPIG